MLRFDFTNVKSTATTVATMRIPITFTAQPEPCPPTSGDVEYEEGKEESHSLSRGLPQSSPFPAKAFASNLDIEAGPENSLFSRCNSPRKRRAVKESGPENWFSDKYIAFKAPSLLNSGIGPEKELLTKLMVLKDGICTRESISIVPERPKPTR